MNGFRKAVLAAVGVLGLGLSTTTFAAGGDKDKEQKAQTEQQQQQGMGGAGMEGQQAELEGDVVKKQGGQLFLKLDNGAVTPITVSQNTQFENLPEDAKQKQGQRALQWVNPGQKVTASVTAQKGKNQAQSIKLDEKAMEEKQIEGKVASASGNQVHIEHNGALIPLKVNKETSIQGVQSLKQAQEGTQVRASFKAGPQGTDNIATKLEFEGGQQMQQGRGGAGFEEEQEQEQEQEKGQY
jgi:hypothetical protein